MELEVKAGDVAIPAEFVATDTTGLPAKSPEGPMVEAVNVTVAPFTGFPAAVTTLTTNGNGNVVLGNTACGVPLVAVMDGGPVLVRVKLYALGVAGAVKVLGFEVLPSFQLPKT
jgi:hypothetical protein